MNISVTDGAPGPGTTGTARHKVLGSGTLGLTPVPTIRVTLDGQFQVQLSHLPSGNNYNYSGNNYNYNYQVQLPPVSGQVLSQ